MEAMVTIFYEDVVNPTSRFIYGRDKVICCNYIKKGCNFGVLPRMKKIQISVPTYVN